MAEWHLALRLSEPEVQAPLGAFAAALGEVGIARYRESLADAEGSPMALPFGEDTIASLMVELADLDGDVDRAVEVLERGEPDTVGIFRRLAAAGRHEEAIEWGRRVESEGRLAFKPRSDHFLDVVTLADCYVRLDRRNEALSLMRRAFTRSPGWTSFTEIGSFADRFDFGAVERAWARSEALRAAKAKKGTAEAVVEIALGEGDHDGAWAAAETYGAPRMMERLAQDTAETHPARAASYYRSRVEAMLVRPDAPSYPAVASQLLRIGQLQAAAGTAAEWESYVRALRQRYSNRPALRRELDKAGLPS